jgi:predicted DsbA family dithiol-disulfide isomerase
MKVEIWSDVMCPFCYIGKRRFEDALAHFAHKDKVEIEWKSFQLNPGLVTDPEIKIDEYLAEKKGPADERPCNANGCRGWVDL